MAYKWSKYILVFIMTHLFSLAFSQTSHAVNNENTLNSIEQIITWDSISYASNYEITIEVQDAMNEWVSFNSIVTKNNTIELYLPVGLYRYNITVYNILHRAEPSSPWYEFEIYKAITPIVKHLLPSEIILNDAIDGLIVAVVDNVVYNTEYTLRHSDGTVLYGAFLGNEGDSVLLDFDKYRFKEGQYTFVASNPGGFEDSSKMITVKKDKTYDLLLSASYLPSFFLDGGTIVPQLSSGFLPLGSGFKLSYFPLKRTYGNFGFSLSGRILVLDQIIEDLNIKATFFPLAMQFLYNHILVKDLLFFESHIGGGVLYLHNLDIYDNSVGNTAPLNAMSVSLVTGLSLQLYLTTNVFVNIGADYEISYFLEDTYIQMIVPSASIGWKF